MRKRSSEPEAGLFPPIKSAIKSRAYVNPDALDKTEELYAVHTSAEISGFEVTLRAVKMAGTRTSFSIELNFKSSILMLANQLMLILKEVDEDESASIIEDRVTMGKKLQSHYQAKAYFNSDALKKFVFLLKAFPEFEEQSIERDSQDSLPPIEQKCEPSSQFQKQLLAKMQDDTALLSNDEEQLIKTLNALGQNIGKIASDMRAEVKKVKKVQRSSLMWQCIAKQPEGPHSPDLDRSLTLPRLYARR